MLNQEGFDKWAGDYDDSISHSQEGYPFHGYYRVLNFVRRKIRVEKHPRVLDIGVGTALLTKELYKQGCAIYGIDFSPKMLAIASEKMPDATLILHDFAAGWPRQLATQTFDYIISCYALHHLTDHSKLGFIKKLVEHLKPDGEIIIADIGFTNRQNLEECQVQAGRYWDGDEHYLVAKEILPQIAVLGYHREYTQISSCAGVLQIKKG